MRVFCVFISITGWDSSSLHRLQAYLQFCEMLLLCVLKFWRWSQYTVYLDVFRSPYLHHQQRLPAYLPNLLCYLWLMYKNTHQEQLCIPRTGVPNLTEPVVNSIIKWPFISDVKHYHEGMCASIVRTGDGSEPLMTCSVPYLQLDLIAI